MKISEIFWNVACLASEHQYATCPAIGCEFHDMRLARDFFKTIFTQIERKPYNTNERFFLALMAYEMARGEGL